MATLIEKEPTTKRASDMKAARVRSLNRLRGKVARRSAKASWWNGVRECFFCHQEIADSSHSAMYRAPLGAPAGTVFVLADNSRGVVGHKTCPAAKVESVVGSIGGAEALPVPRTETRNCWQCRNCGAGVDWRIDSCLLCGYTREKCTSCNGTGIINSGPHPVGCEEPCFCAEGLPTHEVGYYYPPVEVPVEDPNDCAACGDRPAVRDEEGNFTYPRYTHSNRPPVGVCGWCEREGIRV